ncbi:MAG: hypothetical protein OXC66_12490 [Roseovarius sp.]|nr:hypothetical protein [Roseovarius sp.]
MAGSIQHGGAPPLFPGHHILKSGCEVEKIAHGTAERIRRAVAINAVIAWRLAELALLGRAAAELKALQMFGKSEIAVLPDCAGYMGFELRCWKSPDTPLAIDDVSLGEAVLLVARLGASRSRE